MDASFFLFIVFLALIVIGSVAFIGLSFYVGWTGYTHASNDED
jgi:hypothetical protein